MTRLDEPLTLPSGLTLPNRIAKAAMTENLADADNQPTARHERLYRRWAAGGSGLLVTGNLMVDRRHLERSRNIVADRHLDVRRLAAVREAAAGTPMVAQLNHPGRQTNRFLSRRPVAPSDVKAVSMLGLFAKPRALRADEIEQVVERFGDSARLVEQAGFDGVQVHAAHGYLLAQFLSPHLNRRDDEWGGDVAGRARALLVSRPRRQAGDRQRLLGVGEAQRLRLPPRRLHRGRRRGGRAAARRRGRRPDRGLRRQLREPRAFGIGGRLRATGRRRSARRRPTSRPSPPERGPPHPEVPIMLTGGIRTRAAMESLLGSGAVDVIGLGRPIALDPELPGRLLAGEDGTRLPTYRLPTVAGVAGESEWYETQLGRIGDGREVHRGLHPARAVGSFLAGEIARGLSGQRRRLRLAASA